MIARYATLAAVLACSMAGCATMKVPGADYLSTHSKEYFDLSKNIPWGDGDNTPGKPQRVVCVWADTVMYTTGQPPIRGFGGRLMFYSAKGEKPIKVEGDLVVYAFDEIGREPNRVAPDKKYVIPADQLARHYSKGELGHSYSVWLPWDQAGGTQREISMIVRFTPQGGTVLVGEQTRHLLPGAKLDDAQLAGGGSATVPGAAQPADLQPLTVPQQQAQQPKPGQAAVVPAAGIEQMSHAWAAESEPSRKMQTTTIDMSARMGRPTPTSVSQRDGGTVHEFPSVAPGIETTVHYGAPPRGAGGAPVAAAPAAGNTAVGAAPTHTSSVANPSTLGRPGSMRPRNMGSPIERPVREVRPAWGTRGVTSAAPATPGTGG